MHVLITGMAGFAGRHMAEHLLQHTAATLVGITRSSEKPQARVHWHQADMVDAAVIADVVASEKPDAIVHMAAQSNVAVSWKDPWHTYEQNIHGQLNLIQAVLAAGIHPRILIISSNEVYGAPMPEDLPIRESKLLQPNNPYAASKAAQDLMARQYFLSHKLDVIVARPFNHFGPGQQPGFVIPSFAQRIAEIEAGLREPELRLGNMQAQRDFTDVRDVVAAYALLLEKGRAGEIYNVCSGVPRSIQFVLDTLVAMTGVVLRQISDPALFRPFDTPVSFGDATRLREATGWAPRILFESTLADILTEARMRCVTKIQSA